MHLTPEARQIPGTFAITDPSPTTVVFSDHDDDDSQDQGHSFSDLIRHLTKVISRYETLPFGSLPTPFDELSSFGNDRPELGALERAIHSLAMRALSAENALMSGHRTDVPATRVEAPPVVEARNNVEEQLQRIEETMGDLKAAMRSLAEQRRDNQAADISQLQALKDDQNLTLENSSTLISNLNNVAQDVVGQTENVNNLSQAVSDVALDMKYVGQGVFGMQAQTKKALSELSNEVRQIATSVKAKPKLRVDLGTALMPLESRICTLIEAVEKNSQTTQQPPETVQSHEQPIERPPSVMTQQEGNEILEDHIAMITGQGRTINSMASQITQVTKCAQAIEHGDLQAARTLLETDLPESVPSAQFNTLRDTLGSLIGVLESALGEIQQGLQQQSRRSRRESRSFGAELNGCWKGVAEFAQTAGTAFHHDMESTAFALQMLLEGKFDADLPPQRANASTPTRRAIASLTTLVRDITSENMRFFKELAKGNLLERIDMTNLQGSWVNPADAANRMADRLTSQAYEMMETLSAATSGDVTARNTIREVEDSSGPIWTIGTSVNEYLQYVSEIHQELKLVTTLLALGGEQPGRHLDDDPTHPWHQGSWDAIRVSINSVVDSTNGARLQRRRTRV